MTTYEVSKEVNVVNIPLDEILVDSDFNCRGYFNNFEISELAEDIRVNGLLQPVIVVPIEHDDHKFKLIAGFRRFAALSSIGRSSAPCVIKNGLSDIQARTINLVENIKRKDLNILQEAHAIKNLVAAGMTQASMADELGVTTGWLQARLALLKLPEDIQKEAAAGYLTTTNIVDLTKLPTKEQQYDAIKEIRAAREAGSKRAIHVLDKQKKKKEVLELKTRNVTEIHKLQTDIYNAIGSGIATRALAWAAGRITTKEVYQSLLEEAIKLGLDYKIPDEYTK